MYFLSNNGALNPYPFTTNLHNDEFKEFLAILYKYYQWAIAFKTLFHRRAKINYQIQPQYGKRKKIITQSCVNTALYSLITYVWGKWIPLNVITKILFWNSLSQSEFSIMLNLEIFSFDFVYLSAETQVLMMFCNCFSAHIMMMYGNLRN